MVDLDHRDLGNLPEEGNETVHDSANGGEIVKRDQGVHLVLGRAEKGLNKVETNGLEDDTTKLVEESNPDESDLTEGGNHDTDDNGRDVHQNLQIGSRNTHDPTGEKDGNRGGSLFTCKSAYLLSIHQ